MHSASPTESSFTHKALGKSEKVAKLERTKHLLNPRPRYPPPPPLPSDFPPSLAAQLITVTSPADLLSAHLSSSDRRIKLLLCRYSNQIQYGCKNPSCAVPMCLSYRRRRAKTPLRKYTEISARALACHIVEEQGDKGLCWSEPVVPWYEQPGSRERKRSSDGKDKAQMNGHVNGSANGHIRAPEPRTHQTADHTRRTTSTPQPRVDVVNGPPSSSTVGMHQGADVFPEPSNSPISSEANSPIEKPKVDSRSFSQMLYRTFSVVWLFNIPHTPEADEIATKDDQFYFQGKSDPEHEPVEHMNGQVVENLRDRSVAQQVQQQEPETIDVTQEIKEAVEMNATLFGSTVKPPHPSESLHFLPTQAPKEADEWAESQATLSAKLKRLIPEDVRQDLEEYVSTSDGAKLLGIDTTPVRVAPSLSIEFLQYLARCTKLRTATDGSNHKSAILRSEQSSLDKLVASSLFYTYRDPHRFLESLDGWLSKKKGKITRGAGEDRASEHEVIMRSILTLRRATSMDRVLRDFHFALADAYIPLPGSHFAKSQSKGRIGLSKFDVDIGGLEGLSNVKVSHLTDLEVARLCVTSILALWLQLYVAEVPAEEAAILGNFAHFTKLDRAFPEYGADYHRVQVARFSGRTYRDAVDELVKHNDNLDNFWALQLFERLSDVVGTRLAFGEMTKARRKNPSERLKNKPKKENIADMIAHRFVASVPSEPVVASTVVERARVLILKTWDGNAVIRKAGPLGGCLQLLASFFSHCKSLHIDPDTFHMPFLAERLDMMDMPVEWLLFRADNKHVHLLSYSFLFEPRILVAYFRAINFHVMAKSATEARIFQTDVRQFGHGGSVPLYGSSEMMAALRPHLANNFVLTIRRDNVLVDAINQIWRRQKRELMRPLKVRMGMEEGEQGVDIGGVQQEFFRILFAEALDPGYGMFAVDERTRMTWFQPGSLEPLYKFEVLGIFMSLAVYNSITLPITFPLAFYRKLLGLKVKKLEHIEDGWPELTTGLQQLLDWSEGDVSDIFVRTYEFSYEAFGARVDIDMKKFDRYSSWPPMDRKKGKEKAKTASFEFPPRPHFKPTAEVSESSEPDDFSTLRRSKWVDDPGASTPASGKTELLDAEAPLVTNDNREQYVKDYVFWLTQKSIKDQFKAFSKGFNTCLNPTALSIFTPEALKSVVEGYQEIDIDGLEKATKYEDGFDQFSPTIQHFWQVVRSYSTDQHRQLLEFVTASDRVPVNGIKSVQFIVQRNGEGDARLPTSMTCFGRLLLPEYTSRQALEQKLTKAIENSKGFGVA